MNLDHQATHSKFTPEIVLRTMVQKCPFRAIADDNQYRLSKYANTEMSNWLGKRKKH